MQWLRTGLMCLALAPASLADVLLVKTFGSPTGPFLSIQQALDVAEDGDIILVRAPFPSGEPGFTIDGLGVEIHVDADTGGPYQITGPVIVRNTTPEQTVLLSGFELKGYEFQPIESPPFLHDALIVSNAGGPVRVVDSVLTGTTPAAKLAGGFRGFVVGHPDGGHAARVTSSADVAFVRCDLIGGRAPNIFSDDYPGSCICAQYDSFGGSGVVAAGSQVGLYDCTVVGGRGGGGEVDAGLGGAALQAQVSWIFSSGSSFSAGDGSFHEGGPVPGGSGVVTDAPSFSSFVDCEFTAGNATAFFTPPDRDLAGANVDLPGEARSFSNDTVAFEQEIFPIAFDGVAADQVFLILSLGDGMFPLPAQSGVLYVEVPWLLFTFLGVASPTGELDAALVAPELGPGIDGASLRFQAFAVPAGGGSGVLSSWSPLLIVDGAP